MNPEIDGGLLDVLSAHNLGWAVAGGWAIDLFVGRVTREHADTDIAIWRGDQARLRSALASDWHFDVIDNGQPRPWAAEEQLVLPIHEIHARRIVRPESTLEFLLNDHDATEWIYRRDPTIRRAIERAVLRREMTPYLAPEIVLLYKSKAPRSIDDKDLRAALPAMTPDQRTWLRDAIAQATDTHAWLPLIDRADTNA